MIRSLGLAVALIGIFATSSQAASFTVTGSSWSYNNFAGAADPLGIVGRDFSLRFEFTGSTINSALIRELTGAPYQFNFGTGTITNAGNTTFTIPAAGTTPQITVEFATAITGFTDAEVFALAGQPGSVNWGGNFGGGNLGVYSDVITAVPEPSSMLALTGLVAGCGFVRRRRR